MNMAGGLGPAARDADLLDDFFRREGLGGGAHAAAVARGADGVVVGSALIDALKKTLDGNDRATSHTVEAVTTLVKDLSAGVRSVSKKAAA